MQIRLLNPDDAAEFWRFRLEALESAPEAFGSSPEEHRALGVEGIAARLSGDSAEHFVMGAFEDGALAGTAGFFRDPGRKERHKGHIWGVYVASHLRGKGVGRGVLKEALDRAARCPGLEQIALQVRSGSAARSLYESLGFRSFGWERRALKIGEQYIDEEYMVLDLMKTGPRMDGK